MKAALVQSAGFCLSALCIATGAQANLLTNGSFENGSFVPNGDNTMSLTNGATAMTGWTVIGDSLAWIGDPNPFSLTASDGIKFLDLTDYPVNAPFGGVSQDIATVEGAFYRLSFSLGSSNLYGRPAALTASAGDTTQLFTSALTGTNNDWAAQSMTFMATGSTTTVSLLGTIGFAYIGLDDVSVELISTPVPEPSSVVLILAGLGVLGFVARRNKAA